MPRIVFYIRALFHESILPIVDKQKAEDFVEKFNNYFKITAQEYRQEVHKIQLQNIAAISPHIIVNRSKGQINKHADYTYAAVQEKTKEQLLSLSDDDILIPLDDDDWVSPNIVNFPFIDGLSGWHTVTLVPGKWNNLFHNSFVPIVEAGQAFTIKEQELFERGGLLSNCQAFSGKMVKKILTSVDGNALMQRHTRCRQLTQIHGFKEYISRERLSVYVRHACNITFIRKIIDVGGFETEKGQEEVAKYKYMYKQDLNLPVEYSWATGSLAKLAELNKQL